jgi:uncharacterized membrane protein YjgN (DUF898 family)
MCRSWPVVFLGLIAALANAQPPGADPSEIALADVTAAYRERLRQYDDDIRQHPQSVESVLARCRYIDQFRYAEDFSIASADSDRGQCVQSLTTGFPYHPEVVLYRFEDRWDEDAIKDALKIPNTVSWNDSQQARLYQTLSRLYKQHDNPAEARRYAFLALDWDPDSDTRLDAAEYLHEQGRTPEAIKLVLAPDTDDTDAWKLSRRIQLLLSFGARTEATSLYKTLTSDQDRGYDHFAMAKAFANAKDPGMARAELRQLASDDYRAEEVAQYRLNLEMVSGTASSSLTAYNEMRDLGYGQDPLLIRRLSLLGKDPFLPWRVRDGLGLLTLVVLLLGLLAMIAVPGWISNWRRLRRHFQQTGGTWWDSDPEALAIKFDGTAREYFRIWAVNVFLTLITLGIYSAWAKVRKLRYLYRNTSLKGSAFNFHASPVAILKGRLVALPLLLAYLLGGYFYPGFEFAVLGVFLLISPWLLVKSRMFNLGNTSYRNIRFGFTQDFRGAFRTILGCGVLAIITVGALYPYATFRFRQFVVNHSHFGREPFVMRGSVKFFYGYYLSALAIFFAGGSLIVGAMVVIRALPSVSDNLGTAGEGALIGAVTFVVMSLYLAAYTYIDVRTSNYAINHTEIAGGRLYSSLRASELFAIYATNLLAIIVSFGLLTPWATIRVARYRLSNTAVGSSVNLDSVEGARTSATSATGDEIASAFDVQFGL